ncbi:MAG: hypothetical protein J0I06_20595 [Planctomycetes bacterium]|nr:hypothetical protein [Planctomycetota bacterium]
MPQPWIRSLVAAGLVIGSAVLAGCSSRSGKVPVTGSVLVDGAPGSLTVLTFWPEDPNAPAGTGGRVMADEKGQFVIGEKEKDTGLMPGNYKVTFSRFVDRNGKAVHGGGKKNEADSEVPSKESIPEKYRDRASTPASAQVSSSSTEFRFEIATK